MTNKTPQFTGKNLKKKKNRIYSETAIVNSGHMHRPLSSN